MPTHADFSAFIAGFPQVTPGGTPNAVKDTAELRRIRDLPWRPWDQAADLEAGVQKLTQWLRVPGGTRELFPIQAAVLATMMARGSCFAPVPTGGGKTDISLLVSECVNAQRPMLIVPASLRDKTLRSAHDLARQYRVRPLKVLSFESLSLVKNVDVLTTWKPDLMIFDEAHMLKDSGGARWKRITEYREWCKRNQHPQPRPLLMSGSFESRSLRDYWHLIRWVCGDGVPLPRDPMELALWCYALDEKVPEEARIHPGALLTLAPPLEEEKDLAPIDQARARYGRRLLATPGVVGFAGDLPPNELHIGVAELAPSPAIATAVQHLRSTWETPCGLPFETAMDLWRHEREVSCGLYYRWKVQPPPEWLQARRDWSRFVRYVLSEYKRFHTPLHVAMGVHDGELPEGEGLLAAWQKVEPVFKPQTEPVWICDSTLQFAAQWLAREQGICWVWHSAFGRALETMTGVPYFKEEGKNKAGTAIDQWNGPAIASIRSCSKGFDLQGSPITKAKHSRNLIVTCPTTNDWQEQLLSRTHRRGQEEQIVRALYLLRLEGDYKALEQSRADAAMISRRMRQPQRLTLAQWSKAA